MATSCREEPPETRLGSMIPLNGSTTLLFDSSPNSQYREVAGVMSRVGYHRPATFRPVYRLSLKRTSGERIYLVCVAHKWMTMLRLPMKEIKRMWSL